MMTLANYGIGSRQQKDPHSAKVLSKSLQIRNRAEVLLKQQLKSQYSLVLSGKRNEILLAINDYYSRIPFDLVIWNKYQTKQCITESILLMETKFDPYKAKEAFNTVENMLVNLIQKPWHHEFKKIRTYSGYFRMLISDPLVGIEEVFKAAGFAEDKECSMHLVIPEDKMPQVDDGEAVTSVIFDCMMAQTILSDVIDVYESFFRSSNSRQASSSQAATPEVNSNCWIQEYFRERSQQTTERACAHVQALTNSILSLPSRSAYNVKSRPISHNERTVHQVNQISDGDSSDFHKGSSFKLSERTRELLSKQPHVDDDLLILPNDLLRMPSTGIRKKGTHTGRYRDDLDSARLRSNVR